MKTLPKKHVPMHKWSYKFIINRSLYPLKNSKNYSHGYKVKPRQSLLHHSIHLKSIGMWNLPYYFHKINYLILPSLIWILKNFNKKNLTQYYSYASYIYFQPYTLTPYIYFYFLDCDVKNKKIYEKKKYITDCIQNMRMCYIYT